MFKMRESCKYLDVEGKDSMLKECKEEEEITGGARPKLQCVGQWISLFSGCGLFEEDWDVWMCMVGMQAWRVREQESDLLGNNMSLTLFYSSFLG